MRRLLDRRESIRLAKAYMLEHEGGTLSTALSDASCPKDELLATLLHAVGFYQVSLEDIGAAFQFCGGPTDATSIPLLTLDKRSREIAGSILDLLKTIYLLLMAVEHELDAAVYLPADMRRDRVLSVCRRLGIDEDLFRLVLRNQAA